MQEVAQAAEEPKPEINARGRRVLFQLHHNGGLPITGNRNKLKKLRKDAKKESRTFLRNAKRATGKRYEPVAYTHNKKEQLDEA